MNMSFAKERLMPNGVPRWVRIYDNGGDTADRYTAVYTRRSERISPDGYDRTYPYRAMSALPFHPQGIAMWGETRGSCADTMRRTWAPAIGKKCHLGTRIRFRDLPEDCQKLVVQDYKHLWDIDHERTQAEDQ